MVTTYIADAFFFIKNKDKKYTKPMYKTAKLTIDSYKNTSTSKYFLFYLVDP